MVLRRILEILTYLANNHSAVAGLLFFFESSLIPESSSMECSETKKGKGKEKMLEGDQSNAVGCFVKGDIPLILFLKLLSQPLFLQSIAHLEQVWSPLKNDFCLSILNFFFDVCALGYISP